MQPRVVYFTNERLSAINKDVPPALQKSNVIYQFSCHCDSQYVGRASQRTEVATCHQIYPFLLFFLETPTSCTSVQNLSPKLIPSFLLLIQPLDFVFYKILMLNIMMTVDFLFLPKAALLSIYLLLNPLLSKLLTPPYADKKKNFVYSLKIAH